MTKRVFVSYARRDEGVAIAIQLGLERFDFPDELVARFNVPRSFGLVSRDREFARAGDLGAELQRELLASDALIVVCSPAAALSKWVNREISYFVAKKGRDGVFPVLASGRPRFSGPDAAFPKSMRRKRGTVPLAVAFEPEAQGMVVIRLVAAIYDLDLRDLVDAVDRRRRAAKLTRARTIGHFAGSLAEELLSHRDRDGAISVALEAAAILEADPGDPLRKTTETLLPTADPTEHFVEVRHGGFTMCERSPASEDCCFVVGNAPPFGSSESILVLSTRQTGQMRRRDLGKREPLELIRSADGAWLLLHSEGRLTLLETESLEVVGEVQVETSQRAFAWQSDRFVVLAEDGKIVSWRPDSAPETRDYSTGRISHACIQPASGRVIAATEHEVLVGGLDGQPVRPIEIPQTGELHVARDSGRYAAIWRPGEFEIIDLIAAKAVSRIEHRRFSANAAISPMGSFLATGNQDLKVYVLGETVTEHRLQMPAVSTGQSYAYTFAPNETLLAVADLTGLLLYRTNGWSFIRRIELGFETSRMVFDRESRWLFAERSTNSAASNVGGVVQIDVGNITRAWVDIVDELRSIAPNAAMEAQNRMKALRGA